MAFPLSISFHFARIYIIEVQVSFRMADGDKQVLLVACSQAVRKYSEGAGVATVESSPTMRPLFSSQTSILPVFRNIR